MTSSMTLAILHFLILFHFVFSDVGSSGKEVRVFSCQVPRLTWSRSGGTWRQLWRLSGVGVGSPSHTRGSGNLTRVGLLERRNKATRWKGRALFKYNSNLYRWTNYSNPWYYTRFDVTWIVPLQETMSISIAKIVEELRKDFAKLGNEIASVKNDVKTISNKIDVFHNTTTTSTKTTTTTATTAQEVIFVTGGPRGARGGGEFASSEVYPKIETCSKKEEITLLLHSRT